MDFSIFVTPISRESVKKFSEKKYSLGASIDFFEDEIEKKKYKH